MDDNNLMGDNLEDLDLNQEPLDPPVNSDARFGSMLNEFETNHSRIEERIRRLETLTARARQRQMRRQYLDFVERINFSGEHVVNVDGERGALPLGVVERSAAERGKGCKRGSSHLVAKALEMDTDVKKVDKEGGSFYDCNICLEVAREPVLTCCGHLFCWVCFYQVSYIDSTSKECPVCKGEVSDSTVIPIYGSGESERAAELESGLRIPPRPKARRVESARQKQVTNGLSHVPVAEALRRIRISIGIGAMGDQTEGGSRNLRFDSDPPEVQTGEVAGRLRRRLRVQRVSRVLSESAASLSSAERLFENAERLVENLETVMSNGYLLSDNLGSSVDIENNPLTSDSAVIQSGHHQALDSSAAISSSQTRDPSTVEHIPAMATFSEINLPTVPSSSTTRRRRVLSRVSNVDNQDSRESRRRRLS